jgi:hypothetical protein
MAMGPMIQAAGALSGVNILLLLALSGVWLKNYRTFGTSLVLGQLAFGIAMLLENAVALYFFFSMSSLYSMDPHVGQFVLALRAIQLVAISILTYVTMQ